MIKFGKAECSICEKTKECAIDKELKMCRDCADGIRSMELSEKNRQDKIIARELKEYAKMNPGLSHADLKAASYQIKAEFV